MKKLNYLVALVCTTAGLFSCNNEMIDSDSFINSESIVKTKSVEVSPSDTITETCKFLYKGLNYETTMLIVNDSVVSMQDKGVEKLLTELNELPNLVTYRHRDGLIEYFDNREALLSILPDIVAKEEKLISNTKSLRGSVVANPACDAIKDGYYANLFLCDDHNYGGKVRKILLSTARTDTVVNHLKPNYDMNDKTTSFCAYSFKGNTLFELFENDHLKSHCLSFTCYSRDIQVVNDLTPGVVLIHAFYGAVIAPDLKNVHVEGTKKSSWNDRITSVRITRL